MNSHFCTIIDVLEIFEEASRAGRRRHIKLELPLKQFSFLPGEMCFDVYLPPVKRGVATPQEAAIRYSEKRTGSSSQERRKAARVNERLAKRGNVLGR